jgi:hypothetical protein
MVQNVAVEVDGLEWNWLLWLGKMLFVRLPLGGIICGSTVRVSISGISDECVLMSDLFDMVGSDEQLCMRA